MIIHILKLCPAVMRHCGGRSELMNKQFLTDVNPWTATNALYRYE